MIPKSGHRFSDKIMPHEEPAYVVLKSLSRRYDDVWAVADLSLAIEKGESVALLGPSGCGKTTALRMIAGLVAPTAGAIEVGGRDITGIAPHRRNLGYVFQSYALFPHMSVRANVAFGLEERRLTRDVTARRVAAALAQVRLAGLEERRPRELSGGQQQRVALARALAIQPDVLLLDECLSNLDAKLRDAMRLELREIQKSSGVTTIFVTHDQTEALTLCDRVAVMNAGRIEQVASPRDIYDRPATRFVAAFVGRSNQLPATRDAAGRPMLGGTRVKALDVPPAGEIDVFLRPQRILLRPPGDPLAGDLNALPGKITSVLFVGDRLEVAVETAVGPLLAEVPSTGDAPPVGAAVTATWRPEDTLIFPRAAS
jgi:putative spermidine/putrescine transport system ATP-binding protein